MSLAEKLICNSSVLLERIRCDDGTPEKPDVIIDNVWAEVVGCLGCGGLSMDVVVYLNKGDDNELWETEELYRMPFVEDLDVLEAMLVRAQEQSHLTWGERSKPYSDYDF